jgi:hypothetical protein
MYMIIMATNLHRVAFQIFANTAQVSVELLINGFID